MATHDMEEEELTRRFTLSMTSRKTSFFLYRMPSVLQDTAFVTAMGGRACTSSLCDSCVIYLALPEPMISHTLVWDSLLEDLALGRLGIAKVHHLVHELVYDDEIVSYRLLLELFKVFDEDLGEPVEKGDDLGGIAVLLGEREDLGPEISRAACGLSPLTIEVGVSDVEVVDPLT